MTYPELEKRVAKTYAARSRSTNKNSLYDTYKMAIRWASDRIGEQGVMALVTNGSWIGGNVDSGVRACLAEEFSSVYVLNLRGNAADIGRIRVRKGQTYSAKAPAHRWQSQFWCATRKPFMTAAASSTAISATISTRGEAGGPARGGVDRRHRGLADDCARPAPRLDRPAKRGIPKALSGGVEGREGR